VPFKGLPRVIAVWARCVHQTMNLTFSVNRLRAVSIYDAIRVGDAVATSVGDGGDMRPEARIPAQLPAEHGYRFDRKGGIT
jgi:hypothetical protein